MANMFALLDSDAEASDEDEHVNRLVDRVSALDVTEDAAQHRLADVHSQNDEVASTSKEASRPAGRGGFNTKRVDKKALAAKKAAEKAARAQLAATQNSTKDVYAQWLVNRVLPEDMLIASACVPDSVTASESKSVAKSSTDVVSATRKQLSWFTETDPYNPENELSGVLCKHIDSNAAGSLCLTICNGTFLHPFGGQSDDEHSQAGDSEQPHPWRVIHGLGTPSSLFRRFHVDLTETKADADDSASTTSLPHHMDPKTLSQDRISEMLMQFKKEDIKHFVSAARMAGYTLTFFKYTIPSDDHEDVFVSVKGATGHFVKDPPNPNAYVKPFSLITDMVRACAADSLTSLFHRVSKAKAHAKPAGLEEPMAVCARQLVRVLEMLSQRDTQSVTVSMCGSRIPSLAVRAFPLALSPMFATATSGEVTPIESTSQTTRSVYSHEALAAHVFSVMRDGESANADFRKVKRLPLAFEDNHFVSDGCLLFLLDSKGRAVTRRAFEIVPRDMSHVMDTRVTPAMEASVRKAVADMASRRGGNSAKIDEHALREHMRVGWKTWKKFQRQFVSMASLLMESPPLAAPSTAALSDGRVVVVTVGLPGAGKSHFAELVLKQVAHNSADASKKTASWVRINQDTLGSRAACETAFKRDVGERKASAIVDRTNIDGFQRRVWTELAKAVGVSPAYVFCLFLDFPANLCKDRIMSRVAHPTLPNTRESCAVVDNFCSTFVPPLVEEGFAEVIRVSSEEEVAQVARRFVQMSMSGHANA